MTSLQRHTALDLRDASHATDNALCNDWLGLAGYLAEAVAYGDLTVEAAGAELAAEATSMADQQALSRAVDLAAIEFGVDSATTTLLAWAKTHTAPTADVA